MIISGYACQELVKHLAETLWILDLLDQHLDLSGVASGGRTTAPQLEADYGRSAKGCGGGGLHRYHYHLEVLVPEVYLVTSCARLHGGTLCKPLIIERWLFGMTRLLNNMLRHDFYIGYLCRVEVEHVLNSTWWWLRGRHAPPERLGMTSEHLRPKPGRNRVGVCPTPAAAARSARIRKR